MPRQTFTLEQKNFARVLKRGGTEPCEIKKRFKDRYGVDVKASTMSTWYNDKNMQTHEQRVSINTSMDSFKNHIIRTHTNNLRPCVSVIKGETRVSAALTN